MSFLQDAGKLLANGVGWSGLAGDALAFVLGEVTATGRWLIVVDGADVAESLATATRFFHAHPARVVVYPADDARPYDGFSPRPDLPTGRLGVLHRVDSGEPLVVIAPANAVLARVPDSATRARATRTIGPGDVLERDDLARFLQASGYLATGRVEDPGTYAVRGDVVDVWPAGTPFPVRLDFFDDAIEDLRRLDPAIQRASTRIQRVTLLPAREEILDAASLDRLSSDLGRLVTASGRGLTLRRRVTEDLRAGIRFSGLEAWLPALCPTSAPLDVLGGLRTIVVHPEDVTAVLRDFERSAGERWAGLPDDERPLVPPTERYAAAADVIAILKASHPVTDVPIAGRSVDLGARPIEGYTVKGGDLAPVVQKLREHAEEGQRVAIVVDDPRRSDHLLEMLANHGLKPPLVANASQLVAGRISLLIGPLRKGFVAAGSGWAFVPTATLFGERHAHAQKAHAFFDAAVATISELKEGDYVVHRLHGIGLYRGLQRVPVQVDLPRADNTPRQVATGVDHVDQDFVRVEFRDGDLLLLPVTGLAQLSRFVPAHDSATVKLDRLGGVTWTARRGKVRDSILAMATDLLKVYARREVATREPYRDPGEAYALFEARFPYDETPDQAAAIDAVNEDLLEDQPMDRLICGDVGYGKTEVAMRASMRAVESERQVAILCPTTVLALQHLHSFRERFDGLPVRIEMLSRFTSAGAEKKIVAGLRDGTVDIVIGTTRLLGRGVKFARLGLLVIDEEHRFGVAQKERFKKMRAEVDVLAMSATPIPRTLQMALSGMREMSIMATPPRDRLSVRTSAATYNQGHVRDAILHELGREGQVFFVHNRVEDIDAVAAEVAGWVPEARVLVAHGQMDDDELETTLIRFMNREADVLVSSAIIESGIDLPNVNTMLINRADRFGLAQLYQLRGRVGRGAARATCMLLVPEGLSADAKRRIRTIVEHADLGAGFRIAMADLEIRGAGNLLGDSQAGNIDQIGYEAYLELMQEALHEARGEYDAARVDPEVEVPVAAFLPDALFPDVAERLAQYRTLASASSEREVDGWLESIADRCGSTAPEEVENLAGLSRTRILCRSFAVQRCSWLKIRVVLELHPKSKLLKDGRAKALVTGAPKRWNLVERDGNVLLEVKFLPQEAERPLLFLRWVFAQLERAGS